MDQRIGIKITLMVNIWGILLGYLVSNSPTEALAQVDQVWFTSRIDQIINSYQNEINSQLSQITALERSINENSSRKADAMHLNASKLFGDLLAELPAVQNWGYGKINDMSDRLHSMADYLITSLNGQLTHCQTVWQSQRASVDEWQSLHSKYSSIMGSISTWRDGNLPRIDQEKREWESMMTLLNQNLNHNLAESQSILVSQRNRLISSLNTWRSRFLQQLDELRKQIPIQGNHLKQQKFKDESHLEREQLDHSIEEWETHVNQTIRSTNQAFIQTSQKIESSFLMKIDNDENRISIYRLFHQEDIAFFKGQFIQSTKSLLESIDQSVSGTYKDILDLC